MPRVFIIVLNWFKYESTISCVHSLLKLDYENFEIVIVDNDSPNDSVKHLREEFSDLQIIVSKENLGYAGGNELGVNLALEKNAELIWILNNDTLVRADSLTELVSSYKTYGEAIYSNTTLMSENPDIIHYAGSYDHDETLIKENPYDKLKGKVLQTVFNELKDRPARIYGHSLLIPISVIRKYGFMDTKYFMFREEKDYFQSLRKNGVVTRYVRNAIILHESSGSFKNEKGLKAKMSNLLLYYGKRNEYHYEIAWNGRKRSDVLKSRGGVFSLIKFFLKHAFFPKLQEEMRSDFMWNLAAVHAVLGIRGRYFNPNDFV